VTRNLEGCAEEEKGWGGWGALARRPPAARCARARGRRACAARARACNAAPGPCAGRKRPAARPWRRARRGDRRGPHMSPAGGRQRSRAVAPAPGPPDPQHPTRRDRARAPALRRVRTFCNGSSSMAPGGAGPRGGARTQCGRRRPTVSTPRPRARPPPCSGPWARPAPWRPRPGAQVRVGVGEGASEESPRRPRAARALHRPREGADTRAHGVARVWGAARSPRAERARPRRAAPPPAAPHGRVAADRPRPRPGWRILGERPRRGPHWGARESQRPRAATRAGRRPRPAPSRPPTPPSPLQPAPWPPPPSPAPPCPAWACSAKRRA